MNPDSRSKSNDYNLSTRIYPLDIFPMAERSIAPSVHALFLDVIVDEIIPLLNNVEPD